MASVRRNEHLMDIAYQNGQIAVSEHYFRAAQDALGMMTQEQYNIARDL